MEKSGQDIGERYCRLCAKPYSCRLQDIELELKSDAIKWKEVITILSSINVTYIDFSHNTKIGQVICTHCYNFVIKIRQFLESVTKAQEIFSNISLAKEIAPIEMHSIFEDLLVQNSYTHEQNETIPNSNIPIKREDCGQSEKILLEIQKQEHNYLEGKNMKTYMKKQRDIKIENDSDDDDIKSYIQITERPKTTDDTDEADVKNSLEARNVETSLETGNVKTTMTFPEITNLLIKKKHKKLTATKSEKSKASKTTKNKCVTKKKSGKSKLTASEIEAKPAKSLIVLEGMKGYCWTCTQCQAQFDVKEQLSKHLIDVHDVRFHKQQRNRSTPITEEHLTCKICNIVFSTPVKLSHHLNNIHNPNRKKKVVCYQCGKSYTKYLLKFHLMLHDGIKPFVCQVCNMSFVTRVRLRKHAQSHTNIKPFSCPLCDTRFSRKASLKHHALVHSGEKPYACKHCDKKFRNSTNLRAHERVHTNVFPYECKHCDKKFSCWGNCNKHMQRIHNTTLAKTKDTPEGKFPLDPTTGEVIKPPDLDMEQWHKQVMIRAKRTKTPVDV